MSNLTPGGAGLVMENVVGDDNLTPFSSDKIQAKILDLGYGGAPTLMRSLCGAESIQAHRTLLG